MKKIGFFVILVFLCLVFFSCDDSKKSTTDVKPGELRKTTADYKVVETSPYGVPFKDGLIVRIIIPKNLPPQEIENIVKRELEFKKDAQYSLNNYKFKPSEISFYIYYEGSDPKGIADLIYEWTKEGNVLKKNK